MPELRKDPVIGRWVIIATERAGRPRDFHHPPERARGGRCPFCPGNESETPPEVLAVRDGGAAPNGPGWRVRVVSNRYPALQIEGELDRRAEGIYDRMSGVGAHEVVIESPNHDIELSSLGTDQIRLVLSAYRSRMRDLARDSRFRYIQLFKNHGIDAGASQEHSHAQLVATPIVPRRILEEVKGCAQHYDLKERCIYCDIVDQELLLGTRVVAENADYLAIAPFAPRFPFETWLLPKAHRPHFAESSNAELESLAPLLKETLVRINTVLNDPPYNFVIHTSPSNEREAWGPYHWHVEIMPKLTQVAGFEWGTGFYINPTPPEEAAQFLRAARV